jgi:hypothetical protein
MLVSLQVNHCPFTLKLQIHTIGLLEETGAWQKNAHGGVSTKVPLLYTVVLACRLRKKKELSACRQASTANGKSEFGFRRTDAFMPLGQKHTVWIRVDNLLLTRASSNHWAMIADCTYCFAKFMKLKCKKKNATRKHAGAWCCSLDSRVGDSRPGNSRPEIRDRSFETGDSRPELLDRSFEAGDSRPELRDRSFETGA